MRNFNVIVIAAESRITHIVRVVAQRLEIHATGALLFYGYEGATSPTEIFAPGAWHQVRKV